MAFHTNSRYVDQPTVEVETASGRRARALRLRRLPATTGEPVKVKDHDRLDLLAHERLRDGTKFWQIADANTELESTNLVQRVDEEQPRVIQMPAP